MATLMKAPPLKAPLLSSLAASFSSEFPKPFSVSFKHRNKLPVINRSGALWFGAVPSTRFVKLVSLASSGGETETAETQEAAPEPELQDSSDGAAYVEEDGPSAREGDDVEETPASAVLVALQSYKEALASNDESKLAEIEAFFKSIEDEKINLENKIASLSEALSTEKERILRISADFDNFRKRTERDRLSLVSNAQGEVVESLLPVLDNFERAKTQLKVENEGEEKINSSYQSIYKQFMEILDSLGVVPVETVGKPFDPMLHEAIMREESTEFEEGIILDEYRKGFQLGDRLLRPSMVKVSAGPGPAKPEVSEPPAEEEEEEASASESTESSAAEASSADGSETVESS